MAKHTRDSEFTVAVVGEETLLGKDLREVLASRIPDAITKGFAASGEGNFGETEGEAVYVEPLSESALHGVGAVLVAGTPGGRPKNV